MPLKPTLVEWVDVDVVNVNVRMYVYVCMYESTCTMHRG